MCIKPQTFGSDSKHFQDNPLLFTVLCCVRDALNLFLLPKWKFTAIDHLPPLYCLLLCYPSSAAGGCLWMRSSTPSFWVQLVNAFSWYLGMKVQLITRLVLVLNNLSPLSFPSESRVCLSRLWLIDLCHVFSSAWSGGSWEEGAMIFPVYV